MPKPDSDLELFLAGDFAEDEDDSPILKYIVVTAIAFVLLVSGLIFY